MTEHMFTDTGNREDDPAADEIANAFLDYAAGSRMTQILSSALTRAKSMMKSSQSFFSSPRYHELADTLPPGKVRNMWKKAMSIARCTDRECRDFSLMAEETAYKSLHDALRKENQGGMLP